jgi:hypothetical protein
MSVCCECCVLSGRGLGDGPITRPKESYPCVVCLSVIEESDRGGLGPLGLLGLEKTSTEMGPKEISWKRVDWIYVITVGTSGRILQ